MKTMILAAVVALGFGVGAANAATLGNAQAPIQQSNNFNWTEGGGG
jgi:hypothetical protein